MLQRSFRKRRHSEAFSDFKSGVSEQQILEDGDGNKLGALTEIQERSRVIWESLREEHYEGAHNHFAPFMNGHA